MTTSCALLAPAALLIIVVTGCTSMTVQRVPGDGAGEPDGIRYSLPIPVIQVIPGENGTMRANVVYLPDPDRTYAIDASSVLAAHTFKADVSGGLLQRVQWKPDSTAVANDLVNTTSEVVDKVTEARIKRAATATKAIATAEQTLRDHELELAQKEAELVYYRANPGSGTAAQTHTLEVESAKLKLQIAADKESLDSARNASRALEVESVSLDGSGSSGFSSLSRAAAGTTALIGGNPTEINGGPYAKDVWGGVLYAVIEIPSLLLKPIRYRAVAGRPQQRQFDAAPTFFRRKEKLELTPVGTIKAGAPANGMRLTSLKSEQKVETFKVEGFIRLPDGSPVAKPSVSSVDYKTIALDLTGFQDGWYEIEIEYSFKDKDDTSVTASWVREILIGSRNPTPVLSPQGLVTMVPDKGTITQQFTASPAVETIDPTRVMCERLSENGSYIPMAPQQFPRFTLLTLPTGTTLKLNATHMRNGTYRAKLPLTYRGPDLTPATWTIDFVVQGGADRPVPRLFPQGLIVAPLKDGVREVALNATSPVLRIVPDEMSVEPELPANRSESAKFAVALETVSELVLDLTGVAPGKYKVTIPFTYDGGEGAPVLSDWEIQVLVR